MIMIPWKLRSHNEAIKLGINTPLNIVDMSLLEKPVLQPLQQLSHNHYNQLRSHSLAEFHILPKESEEMKSFKRKVFRYCLYKHLGLNSASLQDFLSTSTPLQVTPTEYVYFNVLDQNADSRETISEVISILHTEFKVGVTIKYLVVGGDAKTYEHMQALKLDYGDELAWLLPFPGDFHALKNFQMVLSKLYYEVALKQIAMAGGFKGETLGSLERCSNYKTTHHFYLEVYEALYLHVINILSNSNAAFKETISKIEATNNGEYVDAAVEQFSKLILANSTKDANWTFWKQFLEADMLSYIALFFAVRSGNWTLRVGTLKTMAPLFAALDRQTYRKLIPQHIADCLLLPPYILEAFTKGHFVVSISGKAWHSVAIDEAHEMLINKDLKTSIVHPNKDFISRQAIYFPIRAKAMKTLRKELDIELEPQETKTNAFIQK